MEITYERKVNYYETDAMRIVHHSNYIRYFEEARLDFMNKIGLPYSKMEEEGIMIPVLGVECKYMHSSRFEELLEIKLRIKEYTGVKMIIEYSLVNKNTGKLSVTGETKHCFTNTDLRPVSLKKVKPEMHELIIKAMEYNKVD